MLDYWRLIRPKTLLLVLFTMTVSAWTAADGAPAWGSLTHALIGTALIIAGSVALNQRIEHHPDARMARTAGRPLPTGRLSDRQVTRFGVATSLAGLGYLALFSQPPVVGLAALSWLFYVGVYTPLKSRSIWQTPVGALAGAIPVLLGAATAGSWYGATALALFGMVFLWQFPHSMAIAWLYRKQFEAAGVKVAPVVDPSGRIAGAMAVWPAAVLLPVSLVPCMIGRAGWVYGLVAAVMSAGLLAAAIGFSCRRTDKTARTMLRVSFIYLPAVMMALLLTLCRD